MMRYMPMTTKTRWCTTATALIKRRGWAVCFPRGRGCAKPEMLIDKRLSLFGQYIQTKGVYKCPTDKSTQRSVAGRCLG